MGQRKQLISVPACTAQLLDVALLLRFLTQMMLGHPGGGWAGDPGVLLHCWAKTVTSGPEEGGSGSQDRLSECAELLVGDGGVLVLLFFFHCA